MSNPNFAVGPHALCVQNSAMLQEQLSQEQARGRRLLESSEKAVRWLEGLVEVAEETMKVHQLGGDTITEMRMREQFGRLRIDEIKRDLEIWHKAKAALENEEVRGK